MVQVANLSPSTPADVPTRQKTGSGLDFLLPLLTQKTTTQSGGDVSALQQMFAQQAASANPAGMQALLQAIFQQGYEQNAPVLRNARNQAGARIGSSTQQQLMMNDLQARLTGQGAAAVMQQQANASTTAANIAANSKKETTDTSKLNEKQAGAALGGLLLLSGLNKIFGSSDKKKKGSGDTSEVDQSAGLGGLIDSMFGTTIFSQGNAPIGTAAGNSFAGGGNNTSGANNIYSSNTGWLPDAGQAAGSGIGTAITMMAQNPDMSAGQAAQSGVIAAVPGLQLLDAATNGGVTMAMNDSPTTDVFNTINPWTSITGSDVQMAVTDAPKAAETAYDISNPIGTIAKASGTVICTYMAEIGAMDAETYILDKLYGAQVRLQSPETYYGYIIWATPLVAKMKKSPLLTAVIKPFALAWANEMARKVGAERKFKLLGWLVFNLGYPTCTLIGKLAAKQTKLVGV